MSKYIGAELAYGLFERQEISGLVDGVRRDFPLIYKATDANSLLVVENGLIKQPSRDYGLTDGGKTILFTVAPDDLVGTQLYILYLGRQLDVPAVVGNMPFLYTFAGDGSKTTFDFGADFNYTIFEQGTIVFKNGVQQRIARSGSSGDFSITLDNKIQFTTAPALGERIDVHIFGVQRSDLISVQDNSITKSKIADRSVTAEKLNLMFYAYTPSFSTFNGMSVVPSAIQAEYQELFPLVKVRLKFTASLSGTQDNKIRFTLPKLNNGNTVISATAVIRTASTIESGIVQWGSLNAFDVYRQSGVNFALTTHTIELAFEYYKDPND